MVFCCILHCFDGNLFFLWRFTLFCRKIDFAIYALLCGEKLSQKLCLWRKKDKYHVCQSVILIIILVRSLNLLLGRICLIFPWQKSLAEYPSNTRVYNCHRCQVFQSTTWSYLPVQHSLGPFATSPLQSPAGELKTFDVL